MHRQYSFATQGHAVFIIMVFEHSFDHHYYVLEMIIAQIPDSIFILYIVLGFQEWNLSPSTKPSVWLTIRIVASWMTTSLSMDSVLNQNFH